MLDPARMANSFKTKMEAHFGPNNDPNFMVFANAIMQSITEEFTNYAELNMAHLNSDAITGTVVGTNVTGTVTDSSVVGGVK